MAEKSSIEANITAAEESVETSGRAEGEGILKTTTSCYECPNREKCLHHTGGGDDIQTMYPGYSNSKTASTKVEIACIQEQTNEIDGKPFAINYDA